jgi:hypothetical protein
MHEVEPVGVEIAPRRHAWEAPDEMPIEGHGLSGESIEIRGLDRPAAIAAERGAVERIGSAPLRKGAEHEERTSAKAILSAVCPSSPEQSRWAEIESAPRASEALMDRRSFLSLLFGSVLAAGIAPHALAVPGSCSPDVDARTRRRATAICQERGRSWPGRPCTGPGSGSPPRMVHRPPSPSPHAPGLVWPPLRPIEMAPCAPGNAAVACSSGSPTLPSGGIGQRRLYDQPSSCAYLYR